jgi:hypothetical protein
MHKASDTATITTRKQKQIQKTHRHVGIIVIRPPAQPRAIQAATAVAPAAAPEPARVPAGPRAPPPDAAAEAEAAELMIYKRGVVSVRLII